MAAAFQPQEMPSPSSSSSASTWVEEATQRQDAHLWRLLARACEERGEYREALGYATEALRVQPDNVASLSLLAQLHEKRHADSDAARWHQQVLVQDPTRKTSNRFLAHYHYARDDYKRALSYFTQLLEAEPQLRTNRLYCVLTRLKMSHLRGGAKFLTEVHSWRDLSPEERALAHELFVLSGRRCLAGKQIVRATQYLTWAVEIASTPDACALLAEAVAQDPWAAKEAETGAPLNHAVMFGGEAVAWTPVSNWRRLLQRLIAPVGAVTIAGLFGVVLFLAQPEDFPPQLEDSLTSSAFVPRRSDPVPKVSTQKKLSVADKRPAREPRAPALVSPKPDDKMDTRPSSKAKLSPAKQSGSSQPASADRASMPVVPHRENARSQTASQATRREVSPRETQPLERTQEQAVTEEEPQLRPTELSAAQPAEAPVVQPAVEEEKILDQATVLASEGLDVTEPRELAAAVPALSERREGTEKEGRAMAPLPFSLPTEKTKSAFATLASRLPRTKESAREHVFPLPLDQLWPQLKAIVKDESELVLHQDEEQKVLYGTILQREVRPRTGAFKPYGHFIVELTPGTKEGTSVVKAKIMTFARRTTQPAAGASDLADRFWQKITGLMK